MQKIFCRTLSIGLLSTLALTSLNTSLSVQAAIPDDSLQKIVGESEIWLNTKQYEYNSNTRRWELNTKVSSNTYQKVNCAYLHSGLINQSGFRRYQYRGLSDYEDGISSTVTKKVQAKIGTLEYDSKDYKAYVKGVYMSKASLRDCYEQNLLAENVKPTPEYIKNPKNTNDLEAFYAKPRITSNSEVTNSTKVPVYAYHFQFTYRFPENQRVELSNLYRKQTGADENEVYDGVTWTYTYYTYLDRKTGQYKPWTNPNVDNENGGFLIYKYKDYQYIQDNMVSTRYKPSYAPDRENQITYNLKTKKLTFTGTVPVSSDKSCRWLGLEHNARFVIEKSPDNKYKALKFYYQLNEDNCPADKKFEDINLYTQDMSHLDKEGEEFLIRTLVENAFTEANVENYTGRLMPLN